MTREITEYQDKAREQLSFRVEGMDCASCVGKIEKALSRMDGLTDVQVNFSSETLTLTRNLKSRFTARDVAKKIKTLGFGVEELPVSSLSIAAVSRQSVHAHDHSEDHKDGHACGGDHGHGHTQKTNGGHEHGSCSGHDHTSHARREPPGNPPNVSMHVEGMDCASCVGKIETALARMAGVSDARINFTAETLELTLASGSPTHIGDIEKTIKSLGFGVSDVRRLDGSSPAAPARVPSAITQRWWQTKKGKHVQGLAALMGSAYAVAQFIPGYAEWIFAAAVIAGVLPFARKAFALAISGSPFSIETLMVVASLGALVIGEAEEAAAVVFLFAVGELLESVAAGRARAGIKALASLVLSCSTPMVGSAKCPLPP